MKDTGQRCWGVALWGYGVDEAGRLLGPTGNSQTFTTVVCSSPCPGESEKGNCPRTNQGGFWVGFPTQVQEEEQTSVSLQGSVARPVWRWLQSSLCRKPGHAFVCPCLFCSSNQLFPGKVPCQRSKFDLADPREKETCLHLGGETRVF